MVMQQIQALIGGPLDADPGNGLIVAAPAHRSEQFGGETRAERQFGHALHAGFGRERHDAGDNGHLDACQLAALAEIVEVVVIEE